MKTPFLNTIALLLCAAAPPGAAMAQQPTQEAPLQIQELESGFVIAPDARITHLNNRTGALAGFYAGWLTDRTLLVGGGAYWLANADADFEMKYVGGLARWNMWARRTVGLSTGAFIGFGDATMSRTYGDLLGIPPGSTIRVGADLRGSNRHGGQAITANTLLLVHDDFFVVTEPQVNALWNIKPWMRVDAGFGYRFIGSSDLLGDQLRGASGSVALQFGGH